MTMFFTPESMLVTVVDPIKDDGTYKYKVCIANPSRPNVSLTQIYRRFSDFETVFKRLVDMKPEPPLPPLPEKKLFGSNDPAFVEKRRCEIEFFIRSVIQNRFLLSDVEFLALVGFEQAKDAFAKEMSNTRPTRKVGGVELPDESSLAPWYVPAPHISHDNDYAAAQGFIRGTGYTIQALLPHMSYYHPRKSYALVSDSKGDHMLSIVCFGPNAVRLDDDKKIGYFTRLLMKNLCAPYLCAPIEVSCDSNRVYVVREVVKYGSLRDRLYDCPPMQPSTRKFKGKPKPFGDADIATYGRQMLLAVKALQTFNLCCPNAHLGNWMLQENGRIELNDIESTLLGVGRYPTSLPWSEDGEREKTSIDVLVIGVNLLEMALGAPVSAAREVALLSAQGDPCGVVEVERDEEKAKLAMDAMLDSLPSIHADLMTIIKYIFHPTHKAEVDVLLKHTYFAKGKFKGSIKDFGAAGYEHPQLKLKNKDIEMFASSAAQWSKWLEVAEEKRLKTLEGKAALKELKKNRGKRVPASSSGSTAAPLQISAAPDPAPATPAQIEAPLPSKGVPPPPSKGVPPPPSKGVPPPPSKGVPPPPSKGVPPPPSKGVPPPPSKGVPPPPSKGVPPPPSKSVPPAPPAGGPKKSGGPPGPPPPPPPKKMGGPKAPPPPPPPKRPA